MIRLRTLTINQFPNVAPGTTLNFGRQTILLGKNGSGKTTLLRIISMCLSSDISEIEEDFDIEFQVDFQSNSGAISANVHAKKTSQGFGQQDLFSELLDESFKKLWAEVSFSLDGKQYIVQIDGAQIEVKCDGETIAGRITQYPHDRFPLFRALLAVKSNSDHVILRNMATATSAMNRELHRYDESLETFDQIVADEIHIIIAQVENKSKLFWDLVPKNIATDIKNKSLFGKPDQNISIHSEDCNFLSKLVRTIGFKSATLSTDLISKNTAKKLLQYGNFHFTFELHNGNIISHNELSYGQKRLLAFFWYLECNKYCIVADELVNGLHHDWIAQAMEGIGEKRQAFLSSQNPLLLDYLTFESEQDAKNTFVICDLDDKHQMQWRNLSDSEAHSFYKAYESGFQHVGEILRTKGLW